MEVLKQPNKFVTQTLGLQTAEPGIQYRLSRFVIVEGDAMHNSLTGEALRGADEAAQIARWFKVPADMDEAMLAYQIRQKFLRTSKASTASTHQRYVIMLTTACNAACTYCYEQGIKIMHMTEQTARDVADYIIRHSNPTVPPKIRWFGGEPFCNIPAINTIVDELTAYGMPFESDAFTNGDLLHDIPDEVLKRWKLRRIQLTVDDIGPEYDRIKGLPSGAFDRLCETIDRVTALGIKISLRTHYHPGEGWGAPLRVAQRFCGMKNVSPYCSMLYGGGTEEDYAGLLTVQEYIDQHGGHKINFPKLRFGTSCMADSRHTACITPDGHLSPCEHYAYGENYGDIHGGRLDQSVLKRWAAKSRNYCSGCVFYPACGKMALCPAEGKCSPEEIQHQVNRIKYLLRGTK